MASSNSGPSSSNSGSPCAACKFLRRKCLPGCIFAPYFPPEEPQKFANVHKIFGASNVTKLLNELLPHQREDAVNSLAYEAEARVKDPVYGCVGAISVLQRQVQRLQKELDAANADLLRYACGEVGPALTGLPVAGPQGIAGFGGVVRPTVMGQFYHQNPNIMALPYATTNTPPNVWRAGDNGGNNNNSMGESNTISGEHHVDPKEGGDSSM